MPEHCNITSEMACAQARGWPKLPRMLFGDGNPNGSEVGYWPNDQYLDELTGILYTFNGTPGTKIGWAAVSNFVNIQSFGAVPGADSTDAFNLAVAAADDGMAIYVPSGEFEISSATVGKDVSIIGVPGSILKHKAGATGAMITYTVFCTGELRGVTFDGNKANQDPANNRFALVKFMSSNAVVDQCVFKNYMKYGIWDTTCEDSLSIRDSQFLDGAEHGGVLGLSTMAISFEVVFLSNVRSHLLLDNCRFIQSTVPSVSGKAAGGVHIKGNKASNAWVSMTATGCRFEKVGQNFAANRIACFEVYEFCEEVIIKDCIARDCYLCFCDIQVSSKTIISGNFIYNMQEASGVVQAAIKYDPGSGFALSGVDVCIIENNVIDGIPDGTNRPAIWIIGETSVTKEISVRGNFIKNCPWGINIDGTLGGEGFFTITENNIQVDQDNAFSLGFALRFENFSGIAVLSNNRLIAGNKCYGINAATGNGSGTLILDNNYVEAQTAGFRAVNVAGVNTVFASSGIYNHTAGGTTVRIQAEGATQVQRLFWPPSNYSLNGSESITTADVVTWLGHTPKFAAVQIAPEVSNFQIKNKAGSVIATYDDSTKHISFGPNSVSSTWKVQARNDIDAALGVNFRAMNAGVGGAGQLGVVSADASGYVMAWSSAWGAAYQAGFFGLEAESLASGILLDAHHAGQVIKGYAGNTTQKTFEFDSSAVAGHTRFQVWDVDSGLIQRVKAGANGTGPGGVGRALYIDNI